ncbi:YodC family protein [Pseudomonas sp.]|uniref:YodC family protein n=1 Tax=Pseudomonas sp. TaxID=306 RepID=UPI003FA6A94F
MKQFTPGEIVRLRSGSPSMTVERSSGRLVECAWFVDGRLRTGSFDADALTIDEKGSKQ